jgi:type IV secretory pathway VirB4 component
MPSTPSTTDPIQVKDIREGVIVLKDGSLRGIVQIDAINFELRSGDEQTAIIQQFQGFLNAIDFPLQIVVHSRKYNVQTYSENVEKTSQELTSDLLKLQAQEYIRFVRELSELANIMSKRFYVVLSLQATEKAQGPGIMDQVMGIFKKKKVVQAAVPDQDFQTFQLELRQRADLVLGGLSGMGLKGKVLEQQEVETLFTDLYNPEVVSQSQPTT